MGSIIPLASTRPWPGIHGSAPAHSPGGPSLTRLERFNERDQIFDVLECHVELGDVRRNLRPSGNIGHAHEDRMRTTLEKGLEPLQIVASPRQQLKRRRAADAAKGIVIADDVTAGAVSDRNVPAFLGIARRLRAGSQGKHAKPSRAGDCDHSHRQRIGHRRAKAKSGRNGPESAVKWVIIVETWYEAFGGGAVRLNRPTGTR